MPKRISPAEQAALEALLEGGHAPARLARTHGGAVAVLARKAKVAQATPTRPLRWSEAEDAFLRANLGRVSEEQIAAHLGRSVIAVHLRWRRDLALTAPSRHPDLLTAEQIAEGLGMDGKAVHRLMDSGRMPGYRLPLKTVCRVVKRVDFLRWLINPKHWIYFKPERVGAQNAYRRSKRVYDAAFWQKARKILDAKRAAWGDEWWTAGQVAAHHGVDHTLVNNRIHKGQLPGVRWNNWRILKSDAVQARFFLGKGKAQTVRYTEAGDAFLVLARAVGLAWAAITRLMRWPKGRAEMRLKVLRRDGLIPGLNRRFALKVTFKRGEWLADWRAYRGRFRLLEAACERVKHGGAIPADLHAVSTMLAAWLRRYGRTAADMTLARHLTLSAASLKSVKAARSRLKALGHSPL